MSDGSYTLDLGLSPHAAELKRKLLDFIETELKPAMPTLEKERQELKEKTGSIWVIPPTLDTLKAKAKKLGLWNLFLPKEYPEGAGLSNVDYAHLAEIMGQYWTLSEICNCAAPDTGNMEVLAKYGSAEQKQKYLVPLMEGKIRSVFFMTEPAVASSDATNIQTQIKRVSDGYVINGRKWWSSGALDPRCTIGILMGQSDSTGTAGKYNKQSMVLVPMDAPGVKMLRPLSVMGYFDEPHGHAEVLFENVKVPFSNMILGEGKGFEISQGRLGPGRIHHCMRTIGLCEKALDTMLQRANQRTAFGKKLKEFDVTQAKVADARIQIEAARLLTLKAAAMIDKAGDAKGARQEISMIKVLVPNVALKIIDDAMQVHGGAGMCQDFPLAYMYAQVRTLRFADGPDEVHRRTIARLELKKGKYEDKPVSLYEPPVGADLRPNSLRAEVGGLLAKSKL